jgi:hypothetical protein
VGGGGGGGAGGEIGEKFKFFFFGIVLFVWGRGKQHSEIQSLGNYLFALFFLEKKK